MKIVYKLTIGFVSISLLVVVAALIGYNGALDIKNNYDRISNQTIPTYEALNNLKFAGIRIIDTTNEIVALPLTNKEKLDQELSEVYESEQDYENTFAEYEKLVHSFFPDEQVYLDNLNRSRLDIKEVSSKLIYLKFQGANESVIKQKQLELDNVEKEFLENVDHALKNEKDEIVERNEKVQSSIKDLIFRFILEGFLTFTMALFIGLVISNLLSRPIVKLISASSEIGKGNLDSVINIHSKDEIEDLSHTFNKMIKDLKKSIGETITAKNFTNNIIESMIDPLIVLNSDMTIKTVNKALLDLLNYEEKELIGKPAEIILSKDLPINNYFDSDAGNHSQIRMKTESNFLRKDGKKIPVSFSASAMYNEGKIVGIVCVAEDITEQKAVNERIKKDLEEKEVLLREIHHRVKNNMQIISSLLRLSSQNIKEQKYLDIFADSNNRILSMALVHEKLYQSENLGQINIKEYINDLASSVIDSYTGRTNVTMELDIEDIPLNIDYAVPCGLILNELITNSLKYAFPDRRSGTIRISFKSKNNNIIKFSVSDNGIGIPKEMDIYKTNSLGVHLVTALAKNQLHGDIILNRENGTEYIIEFKGA